MFTNDLLKVDSQKKAVSFLLLAAVLWSLGGMFIKYVQWNSMAISGTRSLIAALTIAVLIPKARKFPKDKFVWIGSCAYAGLCTSMVIAMKLTTAANAIFLQYTAPIYVAMFSAWLLKEKIKTLDLAVIFATAIGMILFFLGDFSFKSIIGNLFGVNSGICFAIMAICYRYIKNAEPSTVVLYGNLIAFAVALPFISGPFPDVYGWLALIFLGIFQLGLSYIIYSRAIVCVHPLEAVIIPTIEPILNPLWVFFFIGEQPSSSAILGGIIVITVVTFYCIKKAR